MAVVTLSDITSAANVNDLANQTAINTKKLKFILNHLDSLNVTSLNTDITKISSANGETVINGPLLEMYDTQATPQLRIEMGYDSTLSDFVFEMWNVAGVKIASLDTAGDFQWGGNFTFMDLTDSSAAVLTFSNLGSGLGYQILAENGANLEIGGGTSGTLNLQGAVSFVFASSIAFAGSLNFDDVTEFNNIYTSSGTTGVASAGTAHTHGIPNLNITNSL